MGAPSSGAARYLVCLLISTSSVAAAFNLRESLSSWLEARSTPTTSGTPEPSSSSVATLTILDTSREPCPVSCDQVGFDSSAWTAYHDVSRLAYCNQTMSLDFALHNPLDNPETSTTIRCCTAGSEGPAIAGTNVSSEVSSSRIDKRANVTSDSACFLNPNRIEVEASLQMAFNGSGNSASVSDFQKASQQIGNYLSQQQESTCQDTITFAYSGSAAVGLFAGSAVQDQGLAQSVLQQFVSSVQGSGYSESVLVQLCAANRSSRYSMGIITNANAGVGFVQDAVATWASGQCVTAYDKASDWKTVTLSMPKPAVNSTQPTSSNATWTNTTGSASHVERALRPRATCSTVEVASGDTCKHFAPP